MILTVTLNPLLEQRLFFNSLKLGYEHRTSHEEFKAGGKGINVSRQLNRLNLINQALTFLGGSNGKKLRSILSSEEINFVPVSTKSETRRSIITIEKDNRITTFFGPNSIVRKEEVKEFMGKLERMIRNCSIVILSGSSPSEEADSVFPRAIEFANEYDKISILDTYGNHLSACLDKSPTVIHNNVSELEKSLNIKLKTRKSKIDLLNLLYSKGVKLSFLTDGASDTFAGKFNFHYKITNPIIKEIDATGSGDAFVAGIAYGLENSLVFNDFVKTASALGTANAAKFDVCNAAPEEVQKFYENVNVVPIGNKLKLIDDSPNY